MTLEEKFDNEIWWVLQKLYYLQKHPNKKGQTHFIIPARPVVDEPTDTAQQKALYKIEEKGCIEIVRQEVIETNYGLNYIFYLKFLPKFEEQYNFYKSSAEKIVLQIQNKRDEESTTYSIPDKYKISVKDREIWINEYLIGKPHAAGSNFEFFNYIRSQKFNTKINRDELPSQFGNSSIQKQVENKSFIKILNGLGFKGEILKAFFCKRGKNTLTYRGDEITKQDLEKAGVKISLFLKELELAHTRKSPE